MQTEFVRSRSKNERCIVDSDNLVSGFTRDGSQGWNEPWLPSRTIIPG
jgi:hypothetical protein